MEKILSISVAAYNVEQYIEQLLDSIIAANVNDKVEVLVVNDGGTDRTLEIAKEYEKKYPGTVIPVDKPNGGHGSTINKGIELATGKYFRALDGDDWLESEALTELIGILEKTDVDIVISNYSDKYEDGREIYWPMKNLEHGKVYQFDEIVDSIEWITYHYLIYKTSILKEHNIRLTEHCFYVDYEFCLYPIIYVQDCLYLDTPLYCYRRGLDEQSVSSKGRKKHCDNSETVAKNLLAFLNQHQDDLTPAKKKYVERVTCSQCHKHYNTIMLFDASEEKKNEILEYDRYVKEQSPVVYNMIGDLSSTIRFIRRHKGKFYSAVIAYRKKKYKEMYQ